MQKYLGIIANLPYYVKLEFFQVQCHAGNLKDQP